MTEHELKAYIELNFPKENEANEWKDYSNLKHVIKGHEGDDIISYMSAIANMEGGHLVLGVEDKTLEIRGIQEFHIYTKDNLKKYLMDNCTNLPSEGLWVDEFVTDDTGKTVWVINVPKHMMKLPVYAHNKAWQRVADSLEEMGRSRMEAILNESIVPYDWSAEPVPGATMEDLDEAAVRYFVNEGIDSGRLPESTRHECVEMVLDGLNLIAPNGKLKRAAILLFGRNPLRFFTGVRFRIGRFGRSETDLISQDVVEGNVVQMADRVLEILKNKYLISTVEYEGLKRKEVLEIPVNALREILYNALAHKAYGGTDIQMQVFGDRVVVWNEGELPVGYTLETLMQPHKSRARNQMVADVFFRAGFIETWGRGIGKVREEMEARGLKMPVWRNTCGGIEVTIEREVYMRMTGKVGTMGAETGTIEGEIGTTSAENGTVKWREEISAKTDLQKRQKELLVRLMDEVMADGEASYTELSERVGKARSTVQQYMLYLSDHGYIRRVGGNKDGHWEVICD